MPFTDHQIINSQTNLPRIISLWRALQSLRTVVSFMNTGAHPDDETSSLLAALTLRDGLVLSFACANRGEGGQNVIGTEVSQDLGVVRTAEMERAADVLGMRLYWLSQHPDDPIHDFGFSKSGVETLKQWDHDNALRRLVEIIRHERPDIVCPTFLDIPGQHGHHRAMTQLTDEAFDTAADTDFKTPGYLPWQITKLYLPAWSGAGDAYDDDLPPPPATLTIDISGVEEVTGWSWLEIGQQSRAYHRTQGMGRWTGFAQQHQWPLHLSRQIGDFTDRVITDGIPVDLSRLGLTYGSGIWANVLDDAQSECLSAIEGWSDISRVKKHAAQALALVRQATSECADDALPFVVHRLEQKQIQLSHVLKYAQGVRTRCALASEFMRPAEAVVVEIEATADVIESTVKLPAGWTFDEGKLAAPENAIGNAYPPFHDPLLPRLPALITTIDTFGVRSSTQQSLEVPPVILPARSASLYPNSVLFNTQSPPSAITVKLTQLCPASSSVELQVPEDWSVTHQADGFTLTPPEQIEEGLLTLPLLIDGQVAESVNTYSYSHILSRARAYPAECLVRVIDVVLPQVRIAYIGGGNDRVNVWLRAMGFDVVDLIDAQLNAESLAEFDTLVVGLFTFRTRPELKRKMPLVHQWVEQGGHLLTLYHRPWDDWDAETVPPRPLVIGKPSLRWRVTDERAPVTYLLPDHSLLNEPNRITDADWAGWHKERGLYFAMSWDDVYEAPLSMQDPGESPHTGALLSAPIGRGRHTHTSLIMHHQMEKLVPGAFRLMANLVAPCR